ncbi:ATP synthase mitochondrial F1 complex assembly factor 2-like [Saccostrea echinata]|uniref:ATP synthase mitochondrial F1 complex assembly factor 2-like n=1 Tax=Saccostrea echinata TaxID=191078 RepID=UPI002A7F03FC|nr:ATP synthase mitochondrial F1 complex assembly factor 2-like [Saccostrea echinata]
MAAPMKTCKPFHKILSSFHKSKANKLILLRNYKSGELKKFFKNATIVQNQGWFEVNLDQRKLRTPSGNLFQVPSEPLALAIATEWNSQKDTIKRQSMHLTTLSNTVLDNPMHRTREDIIRGGLHFLETDTILYRTTEPPEFLELQRREWDPVMEWLRSSYQVELESTTSLMPPEIPNDTVNIISRKVNSLNDWALVGFQYGVENLKSIILMLGLTDKLLTVEKAVQLARLETVYQTKTWGNVEWHHDADIYQLQCLVAAAALFVHWCSNDMATTHKTTYSDQT